MWINGANYGVAGLDVHLGASPRAVDLHDMLLVEWWFCVSSFDFGD